MGLVHRRELLTPGIAILFALVACGEVEDPRTAAEQPLRTPSRAAAPAAQHADTVAARPAEVLPPVANGEPMPAAADAAGIPPYPGAIVWVRARVPGPNYRLDSFTFDTPDAVVQFYRERLPTWSMRRARDVVIFEKEPDQAAITVSPWDYQDLPSDAPEVLRRARTAIGTAWR